MEGRNGREVGLSSKLAETAPAKGPTGLNYTDVSVSLLLNLEWHPKSPEVRRHPDRGATVSLEHGDTWFDLEYDCKDYSGSDWSLQRAASVPASQQLW